MTKPTNTQIFAAIAKGKYPDANVPVNQGDWTVYINAAWELVEEAEHELVGFQLCNMIFSEDGHIEYEATFFETAFVPHRRHQVVDLSAPRAICLAWLTWQGIEVTP